MPLKITFPGRNIRNRMYIRGRSAELELKGWTRVRFPYEDHRFYSKTLEAKAWCRANPIDFKWTWQWQTNEFLFEDPEIATLFTLKFNGHG